MSNDETARLLNEIGQILAEGEDDPVSGTLLYAEVDRGYVAPSVFKDRGDHVVYREPDLDRLGSVLLDLGRLKMGKSVGGKSNTLFTAKNFAPVLPTLKVMKRNRSTSTTAKGSRRSISVTSGLSTRRCRRIRTLWNTNCNARADGTRCRSCLPQTKTAPPCGGAACLHLGMRRPRM